MRMAPDEFDRLCKATCPRCAAGKKPEQRLSTAEWVHAEQTGNQFMSTLCFASFLRNSEYAPLPETPDAA